MFNDLAVATINQDQLYKSSGYVLQMTILGNIPRIDATLVMETEKSS